MGFKKVKKEHSFAQWFLYEFGQDKFDKLINHKKNLELKIDIWKISRGSGTHIWFICENKDYHEFCISADKYNRGIRCKYCARTKYVHPKDSLGQYIIDNFGEDFLNKIWSNKNEKSAFKYTLGSEKKVWFNCIYNKHCDELKQVKNTVRGGFNCTKCKTQSKLQKNVYEYIRDLGFKINTEYECNITPININTGRKLPFDNEVEDLKLIIEVHGQQHYEIGESSAWNTKRTVNEYIKYRKELDLFKKEYAISKGYKYLEIPYWSDDNEESWKKLINNEIEYIKREQRLRRDNLISDQDAIV